MPKSLTNQTTASAGPIERVCPSCGRRFEPHVRICVACGIHIETGRSIVTTAPLDKAAVHAKTKSILEVASWFAPIGVYPVGSEAHASRRPVVTWGLLSITVVASILFWYCMLHGDDMRVMKQAMLWTGAYPPSAEHIARFYASTDYGDAHAYEQELHRHASQNAHLSREELLVAAYNDLPLVDRPCGEFRSSQLVSHVFLHADIVHLAGNMLFLIIIGSKVNALVGNVVCAVCYVLLGAFAGVMELVASLSSAPTPMLGASGAVMGLAGMYLVLFPTQRMHMAAWIRIL